MSVCSQSEEHVYDYRINFRSTVLIFNREVKFVPFMWHVKWASINLQGDLPPPLRLLRTLEGARLG